MNEKKEPLDYGIKLRSFEHGTQKVKCPECQPHNHNPRDNPLSVTINEEGTVWLCHHCGFKGNCFKYDRPSYTANKPKRYTVPNHPQPITSNSLYDYFKKRGISKEIVDDFNIVEDNNGWVSFQYFKAKGGLANIKYRSYDKKFRQEKDAEQIIYNYNRVHDAETVVFVEGEIDVLSIAMAGFKATTLPNGAPKEATYRKNDARYKALVNCPLQAKKIILFTDMDQAGKSLHKELLHRFGKDICWYVLPPDDCKDANDVLVKHGVDALRTLISEATPYPVDGLHTANDYYSQIMDLYDGNYIKPIEIGMKGLDDIYKIMTGTFHTITGIPNHGKSIFLDQILLNLAINHDWSFAIFSPEHSTAMHIRRLVQMYKQKAFDEGFNNRMNKDELSDAVAFIQKHFYFIETRDSVPDIDMILNIAKSSVFKYGINGLVIDPYNEVNAKRSGNTREDEHIRDFISLCKRFARVYEIVCWVVAHPTKLPKSDNGAYSPPTAYDISGAAHWHNQADAVLTIHRDFEDNTTKVITRKIREQDLYGKIGEVKFEYDMSLRSFKPHVKEVINENWNDYRFKDDY